MTSRRWLSRLSGAAVIATLAVSTTGCALVVGAFANHNSRGRTCVASPVPSGFDLIVAGGSAIALGVAETGGGVAMAGLGIFGLSGTAGAIFAYRCRHQNRDRGAERERERLRYDPNAEIVSPQPIRGGEVPPPPPHEGTKRPPLEPASQARPNPLRLRKDYLDDDPPEPESCHVDHPPGCPDGRICVMNGNEGRCAPPTPAPADPPAQPAR